MRSDESYVVYSCVECPLTARNMETLKAHWARMHAREHGRFHRAEIRLKRPDP